MRRCRSRLHAWLTAALCVLHAAGAQGQDAPRLTFAQLVDSLRANFEVSRQVRAYEGREVEIQGFIIPAGPPDLSFFLLSRVSALGNYCCEVPTGQDETVYVYSARSVKLRYDALRVYKVRGRFEAGKHVDPTYGVSMFRVRDARVEEAVDAKIFKLGE